MVALKVWPMSLGTVSEWMLLIFLVIKVSTEDNHLLNLAKCHCPRLSGLHGVNPVGFLGLEGYICFYFFKRINYKLNRNLVKDLLSEYCKNDLGTALKRM